MTENMHVHLDAAEEAKNAGGKPEEAWNARLTNAPQRQHVQRVLGDCRQRIPNLMHFPVDAQFSFYRK